MSHESLNPGQFGHVYAQVVQEATDAAHTSMTNKALAYSTAHPLHAEKIGVHLGLAQDTLGVAHKSAMLGLQNANNGVGHPMDVASQHTARTGELLMHFDKHLGGFLHRNG